MKQTSAPPPAHDPKSSPGKGIGLGVLLVIVIAVAAWLQYQSGHVITRPKSASLAPMTNADLTRFGADTWYLPNDSLLGFVEIPAGAFFMGSDPAVDRMAFENERWSTARNQGTVDLPSFYIGRYEVTVAQFSAFIADTSYKAEQSILSGDPNHPVANVSWTDALAYSRWLESKLKESPKTPEPLLHLLHEGGHITLPDEAQWEKAARGSDGRIYPWGNTASREFANYEGTNTTVVGSFACSKCAFDLADMSGNVWELTRSPYQAYPFDLSAMPNLQTDALFVMRGGSYNDRDNTIRAAVRGGIDPGARRPFIGFRIALTRD
jgi:formylglycine-generating enzyme required for sulfatase activity